MCNCDDIVGKALRAAVTLQLPEGFTADPGVAFRFTERHRAYGLHACSWITLGQAVIEPDGLPSLAETVAARGRPARHSQPDAAQPDVPEGGE